jgi:hypothetical protein
MASASRVHLELGGSFQRLVTAKPMATGTKFGTTKIRKPVCAIRIDRAKG